MLFLRLVSFLALLPATLSAADQWIRLTTPHFEMYTTAGEKKGREAILYFEQVRSFFLRGSPSKKAPDFPVRIIAFRGEKQYKPYRVNDFAPAYYTGSHDRDYIVMEDIQAEHFPVAIHEYTHLIIQHSGMKIPIWMNEGWADLYSTLKPHGKQALVGDLIPGRVQTMLNSRWIPLSVLSSVGHDSALYNERDKAGVFYAESWAFMHMLFLGKKYSAHFLPFVQAISAGTSLPEACGKALGIPVDEVEKDLHAYLTGNQLFGALFDMKLEKSAEEPVVSESAPFETDMALANLLATIHKTDQARPAFERLAKANPGNPEVEESLGYLSWQMRETDAARSHFAKAFAAGTRNPQMCFQYAMLASQAGEQDQAIAALNRAVELKPDYAEAQLQLGSRLLAKPDYAGAIQAFRGVKSVDAQQAEWYFGALAYAYLKTGDRGQAQHNAEFAKKWAKTPAQVQQADQMLSYLNSEEKPGRAAKLSEPGLATAPAEAGSLDSDERPPRLVRKPGSERTITEYVPEPLSQAEGKAQRLDCSGKAARFTILTPSGPMSFDIPDPAQVTIKNSAELTRDFTCGTQSGYRVVVGYVKAGQPGGSVGVVKTLEF